MRFWIIASLLALGFRIALVPLAPRWGYQGDHDDFVRWGIQATDRGIATLYDCPPPRWNARIWGDGRWSVWQRPVDRICNYPPLSVYLLYISGLCFKWFSSDRLINTVTARYVFESWSLLADFVLACGCAALVARYKPGRPARWAYAVALFAPPFWWDSAIWGQMDSLLLAPAVWMLWAMLQQRWTLAGVLLGVMAGLKPQAVLFLPIWLPVVIAYRPTWKPLASLALAGTTLLVLALPFTWHSGLAWWRASYLENLFEAYSNQTTLQAFNIWYLDLLITDSHDASVSWLGITKQTWGFIFLAGGLMAGLIWMIRHRAGQGPGLILWSVLALLMAVVLPTRVHERYILLALPFLLVAAFLWARYWIIAAVWLVVAIAQLTWPLWLSVPAGGWSRAQQELAQRYDKALAAVPAEGRSKVAPFSVHLQPLREQYVRERRKTVVYEWIFTLLALAGLAGAVAANRGLVDVQAKPPTIGP